ncbi:NAD-dependent histone deacetylase sir2 [Xylographa opegraphella]|nr:NAD-dependent histone deacetylase sir2 [Xylographa opegraphella]
MGKSRPSNRSKGNRRDKERSILNGTQAPRSKIRKSQVVLDPTALLAQATALLQTGQPDAALPIAQRALALLQPESSNPTQLSLPALTLLGEIYLELGDSASAANTFLQAVALDPYGQVPESEGGGVEKFLWLAQLCEEGGEESIRWFEKGTEVLERDIAELEAQTAIETPEEHRQMLMEEKRRKLAAALCGMVEVWMTDLSLSPAAETACTALITRALTASSTAPTLQTHASLLLSQCDLPEARSVLSQSLSLWQDLSAAHSDIPDFPTRISLSRLLMEAGMEDHAMGILEGLVAEEDGSVEAWYLGGWCASLMAGLGRLSEEPDAEANQDPMDESTSVKDNVKEDEVPKTDEERNALLITSREWLRNSLRLYEMQEYEDDRLRDHAVEVVEQLDGILGDAGDDEVALEGEEWEEDSDDDGEGNSEDGDVESHKTGQRGDLEMNGT